MVGVPGESVNDSVLVLERRLSLGRRQDGCDSTVEKVATVEEAGRVALGLPEVAEGERHGHRTWFVAGKAFVWERPLTKADIKRLDGAPPPEGELIAVATANLEEKEAILAEGRKGLFTITHFDGYPSLLIQLTSLTKKALREALIDAWSAVAPDRLARDSTTGRK